MNENWTPKNPPELSDADAELLSAYIDNQLDASERAAFEARLQTDAFLRGELVAMRQMLGWLNTMPTLKAPRNFTITEADVKPNTPKIVPMPRRSNNWQVASAAAVFLVLVGFVALSSQLNLAPKQDNTVALLSVTDTREQASLEQQSEATLYYAATSMPFATAGFAPMGGSGGDASGDDAPETDAESAMPAEVARSAESGLGVDAEMNPPDAYNAEIQAPEGSGGDGSITASNVADGTVANDSTANAAGSSMADNQDQPNASPVADLVVQPTMEVAVEETSLTTMSVIAESTPEMGIAMSAPVVDDAADSAVNAQIAMVAVEPLSPELRLRELLLNILQQIIARSQN